MRVDDKTQFQIFTLKKLFITYHPFCHPVVSARHLLPPRKHWLPPGLNMMCSSVEGANYCLEPGYRRSVLPLGHAVPNPTLTNQFIRPLSQSVVLVFRFLLIFHACTPSTIFQFQSHRFEYSYTSAKLYQ